jgi:hypothetical protein
MTKIYGGAFSIILFLMSANTFAYDEKPRDIYLDIALKTQVGEYHPPYVAAWIENQQAKSVRTLLLWRKEPKWLKDIRRWWRKEGKFDAELVDAITSATHSAGNFPLRFQAVDNNNQPLKSGKYTLFVEVVREKGGRALIRQPFELKEQNIAYTLAPTPETNAMKFSITASQK